MWKKITQECAPEMDMTYFWDASTNVASKLLHEHPEYFQYLAGVLRTAYLKDTVIVCTWAEIIDGIFMLAVGPEDVHKILGISYKDPSPIVIRGNAPTFAEMLYDFFIAPVNPQSTNDDLHFKSSFELRRAVFGPTPYANCNLMPPNHPLIRNPLEYILPALPGISAHIFSSLPERTDTPAKIFRDIRILHEQWCKVPEGRFSLLEKRWNEWNTAIDKGLIRYEYFPLDEHPLSLKETIETYQPIFERQLREISSNTRDVDGVDAKIRTDLFALNRSNTFDALETEFVSSLELQDLYKDFYQFTYQLAIAEQHNTDWISIKLRDDDEELSPVKKSTEKKGTAHSATTQTATTQITITTDTENRFIEYMSFHPEISQRYINRASNDENSDNHSQKTTLQFLAGSSSKKLSEMPATVFTELCYTSRESIKKWREGTLHRVEEIDYAISRASSSHTRADDYDDVKRGGILALILAVISWIIDQSKDSFGFGFGLWMVPLIALIVTVLPEALNLCSEWKTLRGDTQTIVIAPGE